MNIKNVKFIKSAADKSGWIDDNIPEIVLLGRSNVGKSTFVNNVSNNASLAKVSIKPGKTKLLNFFDAENSKYRLVDAPGYGYAGVSRDTDLSFAKMMSEYLSDRENLKGAFLLLDSRRIPNEDDININQILVDNKIPYVIIATKYDKLNQSEKAKLHRNIISTLKIKDDIKIIHSSINDKRWIDEVILNIETLIK